MNKKPQFIARISFHFNEHDVTRSREFKFGPEMERRVPMKLVGMEDLYTVLLHIKAPSSFKAGDSVEAECRTIAPDILNEKIKKGCVFSLWDCGFFADGIVLERIESGWKE